MSHWFARKRRSGRHGLMARYIVVGIFAAFFGIGTATGKPVVSCNDPSVLKTILDGTLEETRSKTIAALRAANSDSHHDQKILSLRSWSAKLSNIRQLAYDEGNNVRYCAAEFVHENLPSPELAAIMLLATVDRTCIRNFVYQLENILDKPSQFYVTWECIASPLDQRTAQLPPPTEPKPAVKSKIDILGFAIGMTLEQLEAKASADGFRCRKLQNPDDYGQTFACISDANGTSLRFAFTRNLEMNVAKRIQYRFRSQTPSQALMESVIEQFRPIGAGAFPNGIALALTDGVRLELVQTTRPNEPAGYWEMSLIGVDLPQKDNAENLKETEIGQSAAEILTTRLEFSHQVSDWVHGRHRVNQCALRVATAICDVVPSRI